MTKPIRWAGILGLVFVACSGAPGPHPAERSTNAVQAAGPNALEASFAAMNSSLILAAAMRYPVKAIAEDPPLSLTASDGTGLKLSSLEARAVVEGPLAFTELRLRFDNPADRVIEGRFAITLPPEAAISRLAMRTPAGWQEAEVVEKQLARQAYEDFLHRKQDPALLEKEAGNEFRARIFPIPARGSKELIVSYSHEIRRGDRYKLPLRGLPAIDELSVTGLVAGRRVSIAKKGAVPDRDFEMDVPADAAGLRSDEIVLVRVRPEIGTETAPMGAVTILFDTSASRALGFAQEVDRLGRLVAALRKQYGASVRLSLATFDQVVTPIFDGTIDTFSKQHLDAVLARRPLGASDLTGALAWLGQRPRGGRAILVTDAVATAGSTEAETILAKSKALRGVVDRMDVLLVGGIRDDETARRLVRGAMEHDGIVIDGSLSDLEIVRRLAQSTRSGIRVKIPSAEWIWPEALDGVLPGDEVLVYGILKKGSIPAGKPIGVELTGGVKQQLEAPVTQAPRPLLERAAARAEIARLAYERDNASDRERQATTTNRMVRLSERYRVVSDVTSLLVLETDDDYARFGIDRTALADILVANDRGIDVMRRTKAVVAIPTVPKSDPPAKAKDKPPVARAAPSARPLPTEERSKPAKKAEEGYAYEFSDDPAMRPGSAGGTQGGDRGALTRFDVVEASPDADTGGRRGAAATAGPRGAAAAGPRGAAAPGPPPPPPASRPLAQARARQLDIVPEPPASPVATEREDSGEEETSTKGPPPYTGKMADIMRLLEATRTEEAIVQALGWHSEEPGDVLALVALGESLEAAGRTGLAARAYGSILDLFPARADMRRFAAERLERLGVAGQVLAADAYAKAVAERPDHLNGHRLLAYALVRAGRLAEAFTTLEGALGRSYPSGRFAGGERVLREDLGIVGAAWLRRDPSRRDEIARRLAARGAELATKPSLRFVLYWETDANDVDFHIRDGRGGHAFFRNKKLASGGELYEDVTTGYGPECFTIVGEPQAYPYRVQIHYYSRGPMGYGMGKLEIVDHDGKGGLHFEQRPFVVMNDRAFVDLGQVTAAPTAK